MKHTLCKIIILWPTFGPFIHWTFYTKSIWTFYTKSGKIEIRITKSNIQKNVLSISYVQVELWKIFLQNVKIWKNL